MVHSFALLLANISQQTSADKFSACPPARAAIKCKTSSLFSILQGQIPFQQISDSGLNGLKNTFQSLRFMKLLFRNAQDKNEARLFGCDNSAESDSHKFIEPGFGLHLRTRQNLVQSQAFIYGMVISIQDLFWIDPWKGYCQPAYSALLELLKPAATRAFGCKTGIRPNHVSIRKGWPAFCLDHIRLGGQSSGLPKI